MVNTHLSNFTGSLIALDELIERERVSAAKVIEAAFQHDIHVAINRVGEINKVASARIVAAAQVASAKAATDAEVGAATLASLANSALSRLSDRAAHRSFSREDTNAIINAASELAGEEIGVYAPEAINAIASEAEAAVKIIKLHGEEAIARIQSLSDATQKQVEENAAQASEKLNSLKTRPRVAQEIIEHAHEAEGLLVKQYGTFKVNLEAVVTQTRKGMATVADQSIAEISAAVSEAEKKITESRDKAIGSIREFAAKVQK